MTKVNAAEKAKCAAAKTKPGKKDPSVNVPQHTIFAEAANFGEKIPVIAESDLKKMDLNNPAIIDLSSDTAGKVFSTEAKLSLGQLKKMFKQASQGRAEVALDLVVIQHIANELEAKMPDGMSFHKGKVDSVHTESKEMSELLHRAMLTTSFAINQNQSTFAMEKLFLPCLRFSSEGVRQVVMFPYAQLAKHVAPEKKLIDTSAMPSFDSAKLPVTQFLKFCSAEKLKAFMETDGAKCFSGSVRATQVLYVPAGWSFAELTKEMSLGLKSPLFVGSAGARKPTKRRSTDPGPRKSRPKSPR